MPAPAIIENAIVTIVADDRKIQASVECFARIKITARYDRNSTMFHFSILQKVIDGAPDLI